MPSKTKPSPRDEFWASPSVATILSRVTTTRRRRWDWKLKALLQDLRNSYYLFQSEGDFAVYVNWLNSLRIYINLLKAFVHYFDQKHGNKEWDLVRNYLRRDPKAVEILKIVLTLSSCKKVHVEASLNEIAQQGIECSLPGNAIMVFGQADAGFEEFVRMTLLVLDSYSETKSVPPMKPADSKRQHGRRDTGARLAIADNGDAIITLCADSRHKVTLNGNGSKLIGVLATEAYKDLANSNPNNGRAHHYLEEVLWGLDGVSCIAAASPKLRRLVGDINKKLKDELGLLANDDCWISLSRGSYTLTSRLLLVDTLEVQARFDVPSMDPQVIDKQLMARMM